MLRYFTSFLMSETRRNYPTRLETRTKEFNWIASRTAYHYASHLYAAKRKQTSCQPLFLVRWGAAQADYGYAVKLDRITHSLSPWEYVLIKPKSRLVETRKMVNYARTWWSQVKTWWKLALCGTDVQIVAAWPEYRGERLIEPSSSWFPPKFPLG